MFQSYQAVGRLTRDTEVRDAGEHKVGDFGIAINGFKDEVLFLNCQTWNKQAESLAAECESYCLLGKQTTRGYSHPYR